MGVEAVQTCVPREKRTTTGGETPVQAPGRVCQKPGPPPICLPQEILVYPARLEANVIKLQLSSGQGRQGGWKTEMSCFPGHYSFALSPSPSVPKPFAPFLTSPVLPSPALLLTISSLGKTQAGGAELELLSQQVTKGRITRNVQLPGAPLLETT